METITVERLAGVVTVTLNRPERKNAVNGAMWDELLATFTAIARNPADRCVIITGAGGDFCSGADLAGGNSPAAGPSRHQLSTMRDVRDVILALYHLPQPTIAKVRGVAVGVGMNFALTCDLVVAADTARFSEIFARRGLTVDGGGSWSLPRRVGLHKAKELVLFADIISGNEAAEIGLVNRVLPEAELDAFVDDWAQRLAGGPPIALAQSKRLLNNSMAVSLETALEDEGAAQTINFATKDTPEAITAWLEKRAPTFQGR
jgi:enoyl-CoA hydratase/carnithine racemase